LGAQRVEWTYPEDADFVVLADTEGNLFCVIASGPRGAAPHWDLPYKDGHLK
jgi:hypothetical protein